MEAQSDGQEPEQIADAFLCCVCLDLLYKPVVLACGHASCFWCVHKSMSGLRESHCPLCRHPYHHFPTICQMLHALILKMYPLMYERRGNQILAEEKSMGFFSPSFDDICASHAKEEACNIGVQSQSSVPKKIEFCESMEQLTPVQDNCSTISKKISNDSNGASSTAADCENELPQTSYHGISQQILIDDLLCAACKHMLFRPAVLNCGHAYCESCLAPTDGSIKCQTCQSPHPKGFPKVYLELDHFIEELFPKEYMARKSTVQLKEVQFLRESQPNSSIEDGDKAIQFPPPSDERFLHWCADNSSKVHVGAGCDYCGMYPIIGDRYRCKDCKEAIGFDLCGDCYSTQSKLPGRFNQQHTPDHQFEFVKSSTLYNIILRLLRGQSENGTRPPVLVPDTSENIENDSAPSAENAEQNLENVGLAMLDIPEEQQDNDTHPTM